MASSTNIARKKPAPRSRASVKAAPQPLGSIDQREALALVMELMAIPGPSGQESAVADYVVTKLRAAGANASAILTDDAHKKTPVKGQIGNLIFQLPGTLRAPRRLLMSHMDTVPICV